MKIQNYNFSDYRIKQAQKKLDSRSCFKKIIVAIQEFFGIKEGSALQRILDKSKFYGKKLQSYNHEETILDLLKNFFSSKDEKQNYQIQKEKLFKCKVFENLAFLKAEATSCKTAITSAKAQAAYEIDVQSVSALTEMLERCREMEKGLNELSNEVKRFPEFIFGGPQKEYDQLKGSLAQAYADVAAIRAQCSVHFTNLVYEEMQANLKSIEAAESMEEKVLVRDTLIRETEQCAQSKAYLLTDQDRNFLNEIFTVTNYLANLGLNKGKLDFDDILSELYLSSINEIIDGPLEELNEITDLAILKRAVDQLDRKIQKHALQIDFTSNLMKVETHSSLAGDIGYIKEQIDIRLNDEIIYIRDDILMKMNAFNAIPNTNTFKSKQAFFKLKKEIEPELIELQKFVEFAGPHFVFAYSGQLQTLRDDIDYKGWIIENSNLTFFSKGKDMVIGMDKFKTAKGVDELLAEVEDLLDVVLEDKRIDTQDIQPDAVRDVKNISKMRMDASLAHFQETFGKIQDEFQDELNSLKTFSNEDCLTDMLEVVALKLEILEDQLRDAIAAGFVNNEDTAQLESLLSDVQLFAHTLKPRDSEMNPPEVVQAAPFFVQGALKSLTDSSKPESTYGSDMEQFEFLQNLLENNLNGYLDLDISKYVTDPPAE